MAAAVRPSVAAAALRVRGWVAFVGNMAWVAVPTSAVGMRRRNGVGSRRLVVASCPAVTAAAARMRRGAVVATAPAATPAAQRAADAPARSSGLSHRPRFRIVHSMMGTGVRSSASSAVRSTRPGDRVRIAVSSAAPMPAAEAAASSTTGNAKRVRSSGVMRCLPPAARCWWFRVGIVRCGRRSVSAGPR